MPERGARCDPYITPVASVGRVLGVALTVQRQPLAVIGAPVVRLMDSHTPDSSRPSKNAYKRGLESQAQLVPIAFLVGLNRAMGFRRGLILGEFRSGGKFLLT